MGVYFPPSTGLDPSSASILHITRPRDSELAMLFAEHARWAQRETLKALRLAAADASQAVDSASRAAAGVSSALRQPGVEFPVYKDRLHVRVIFRLSDLGCGLIGVPPIAERDAM
eukprot:6408403-Pyramimonas_sp.AAC.1